MPATPGELINFLWVTYPIPPLQKGCWTIINHVTATTLPPPLSGRHRIGFAYESLKDRLPVIKGPRQIISLCLFQLRTFSGDNLQVRGRATQDEQGEGEWRGERGRQGHRRKAGKHDYNLADWINWASIFFVSSLLYPRYRLREKIPVSGAASVRALEEQTDDRHPWRRRGFGRLERVPSEARGAGEGQGRRGRTAPLVRDQLAPGRVLRLSENVAG